MNTLPKRRRDLLTAWYWIERRILKHGKPEVLQLVPRKCYYVVRWDRPRLPPKSEAGYRGANNLMRIPAGSVLYKRYVPLGDQAYLRRYLDDPKMAERIGFFEKNGKIFVPIFEVVDGLAFAQRKSDHMLAGWNQELVSLRKTVTEGRLMLADQNLRIVSPAERRSVQLAVYQAEKRIGEIETMVGEHIHRQVTLKFAFERACSRLDEMAVILERIALHISTRNIRISAIQVPTNNILSELPFFSSKEIRELTREVIKELTEIKEKKEKNVFATYIISDKLRKSARLLFAASTYLREEAEKVPEEEKLAARELTDV